MVAAVGRSHDVRLVDSRRPMTDQVADPAVDVVVDHQMQASPELAAASAGHVRLWQLGSVGYDAVDVASLARAGLPVAHCPGSSSARGLAEHALMLAMLVLRRFPELERLVGSSTLHAPTGRQLVGRTILLVGFGASARALAPRATSMGMRVIAVRRRGPDAELGRRHGVRLLEGMDRLDDLLPQADLVSLNVPHDASTRHILDRCRLNLLPQGAVVVNVARGGLIDEVALADLIRAGRIAGAGLDVVEGEPATSGHPLWQVPGIVITPQGRRRDRGYLEATGALHGAQHQPCGSWPGAALPHPRPGRAGRGGYLTSGMRRSGAGALGLGVWSARHSDMDALDPQGRASGSISASRRGRPQPPRGSVRCPPRRGRWTGTKCRGRSP